MFKDLSKRTKAILIIFAAGILCLLIIVIYQLVSGYLSGSAEGLGGTVSGSIILGDQRCNKTKDDQGNPINPWGKYEIKVLKRKPSEFDQLQNDYFPQVAATRPDSDGNFRIENLPIGEYGLKVNSYCPNPSQRGINCITLSYQDFDIDSNSDYKTVNPRVDDGGGRVVVSVQNKCTNNSIYDATVKYRKEVDNSIITKTTNSDGKVNVGIRAVGQFNIYSVTKTGFDDVLSGGRPVYACFVNTLQIKLMPSGYSTCQEYNQAQNRGPRTGPRR